MEANQGKSTQVELSLHVPLKERTSLHARHAVQGQLFESDDGSETRGYRGIIASKVAGITYRQLDYWARKQIVEPSINPSHGSGSRRLYSFKDVVILAVSKKLLDAGVNLQNVTSAIGYLMQRSAEELEDVTILCDGDTVHECTTDEEVISLVRGGSAVFGVSVGSLWHAIKDALEHEDYVDLTDKPVDAMTGRPIDELTARRLRKKLEAHAAERAARQA